MTGPRAPLTDPRAAPDPRPVLFVTTEVPPDRVGAFRALAATTPIELALFGGGLHATAGVEDHGLPARQVSQREVYGLAASGRYRAVVAGTVGRTALPAAWLGAERARVPFLLWSALWAHPRSLAHLPGSVLLRLLYRRAACVVTYGPHVSAFAQAHGARRTIVAPQAVDARFWSAPVTADRAAAPPRLLFVGRDDPGKGVDWLLRAWEQSTLGQRAAAELRLAGPPPRRAAGHAGVQALGSLTPEQVRAELAAAAALVVPSERTATFREPWGLVVNEALHAGTLVIASTEVGAVAGGLLEAGQTGTVVPAGDVPALAAALTRAVEQGPETGRLAAAGRARVEAYTHEAWAAAFAAALAESVALPT